MTRKAHRFLFTVEGSGSFPIDMLRYDRCWPANEGSDSYAIETHPTAKRRRIVLETQNELAPTNGRWESFGWKVLGIGEYREKDVA